MFRTHNSFALDHCEGIVTTPMPKVALRGFSVVFLLVEGLNYGYRLLLVTMAVVRLSTCGAHPQRTYPVLPTLGAIAFALPLAMVAVVNGALAQQSQQVPLAAAPQSDVQDSLKKINDSMQDVQLKTSSVVTAQSQQPAVVPTPLNVSIPSVSGKAVSSSATWNDNRGSFRLEFPTGQICSLSYLNENSVDSCH